MTSVVVTQTTINASVVQESVSVSVTSSPINVTISPVDINSHSAVTIGTANGLSLSGQVLSLGLSSSLATGALSNTDWSTFNNKQNALGYTPVNIASADWIDLTDGGATLLHSHAGGGAVWGAITGTLSNQTDLQTALDAKQDDLTFPIASTLGGTGVNNAGTLTNASNTTITGGGTVALGGFTLSVPASLTVAGLAVQNVFSVLQTVTVATASSKGLILKTSDNSTTNTIFEIQTSAAAARIGMWGDGWVSIGNVARVAPLFVGTSAGNSVTGAMHVEFVSSYTGGSTQLGTNLVVQTPNGTNVGSVYVAMRGQAKSGSSATSVSRLTGFEGRVLWQTTSGTLTTATGGDILVQNTSTGTIDTVKVMNIQSTTNSGGGTVTANIGLMVEDQTVGTTSNKAIQTTKGLVTFGDKTTITGWQDVNQLIITGFTTQTLPPAYFIDNTAATNAVRNVLQLETQSTGTAAVGLGAGLVFSIETATASTMQTGGLISTSWIDATNASRKATMTLSAYDSVGAKFGASFSADGSATNAISILGAGAGKITLSAPSDVTLTVPASLTVAGLAVQNIFTVTQTIQNTDPIFILNNTTAETTTDGNDSLIRFAGVTSGAAAFTIAQIVAANTQGVTQRGDILFQTNDGVGNLRTRFKVGADGQVYVGSTAAAGAQFNMVSGSANKTGFFFIRNTSPFGFEIGTKETGPVMIETANGSVKMSIWNSGNVGIGHSNSAASATEPSTRLHVVNTTTTTNAVLEVFRIETLVSTGATGGANGFGAGQTFYAETATDATSQQQGLISTSWIDATNASRKAKMSLSAYDTAARLGIEVEASGTVVKIGLFGGTTAIQQVLNAYTSDGEGAAYTGIDNLQVGAVYATVADLNQLRIAYETLRASYDDLRTKLQTSTLVA